MPVPSIKDLKTIFLKKREIDLKTDCWVYTGWWDASGYGRVAFSDDRGVRQVKPVHVVSASLWLDVPLHPKKYVAHKVELKCCRACFNPKHLMVFNTRSEACIYYKRRSKGTSKIDDEMAESIIRMLMGGESAKLVAEFWDVSHNIVKHIARKATWGHVWEKLSREQSTTEKTSLLRTIR
jgi:hypothetical protein